MHFIDRLNGIHGSHMKRLTSTDASHLHSSNKNSTLRAFLQENTEPAQCQRAYHHSEHRAYNILKIRSLLGSGVVWLVNNYSRIRRIVPAPSSGSGSRWRRPDPEDGTKLTTEMSVFTSRHDVRANRTWIFIKTDMRSLNFSYAVQSTPTAW